VCGLGALHRPHVPDLPGLSDFSGTTFHTARWNHEHDLRGRNVAVIGSAASAVQLVPLVAQQAARVHVLQRTPNWIIPRHDRAFSTRERTLMQRLPALARLRRWLTYGALEARFPAMLKDSLFSRALGAEARRFLQSEIPDTELRRKLTPSYPPGCKRILVSDDFYAVLRRPNVELVTDPIERITRDAIVTRDGVARPVDTIVLATGFEPMNLLHDLEVVGVHGAKLGDVWKDGIRAHRTVAVPGFPSFFLLLGPNSALGHSSVVIMIEAQVRYVMRYLESLRGGGWKHLQPRADAAASFDAKLQDKLKRTVWKGSCQSWYQDTTGRVFTLWPGSTLRYLWEMRRPRLDEYEEVKR